ncbi:hypothetical protein TI39_contig597g00002 [Zymoseptoria brevis]|uniref:Fungal STAND N-terminal Goodbye domain-containing protein n=1 Tax=Zymoseptoria brevis TaxID=1047168 RepID=A0A0F4GKZ2_9PEZI|nr:hypothetical protein TI39_contig597g00002 [Zymoseptoria brevis]
MPMTIAELIKSVENQNQVYKHFRERLTTLFKVLKVVVTPIELVGNLAAGAASAVFPPSSMCFGAVMYLIGAARGVSASLDAIAELLDVLKDIIGLMTRLEKLTSSEDRLVGAETLVQAKRTGHNVEAVQMTLTETTVDLQEMSLTQNQMAHGVGQILNTLEDSRGKVKQEQNVKYMETINRVLTHQCRRRNDSMKFDASTLSTRVTGSAQRKPLRAG